MTASLWNTIDSMLVHFTKLWMYTCNRNTKVVSQTHGKFEMLDEIPSENTWDENAGRLVTWSNMEATVCYSIKFICILSLL